ncbi:MAG TPA: DUF2141 domain-containing protein [Telluria sp.]
MPTLIRPLVLSLALLAPLVQAADLGIRVDNVQSCKGQIMVALYDKAAGFLKRPLREVSVPAKAGSITVVLKDLVPGDYGFAVYHDANGNGRLDTNPMGIPIEPVAFSKDAQGRMGPPSFDAVKLAVPAAGSTVSVKLR